MTGRVAVRAATVAVGVLYLAASAALGSLPSGDDDGAKVAAWFRDNDGHVRLWLWFITLAVIAFAVFASLVRVHLPAPHRDMFLIGAVVFVVQTAAQGWVIAGMAWHSTNLDPATARTLLDVASYWGPVLTAADVLILAPVMVLAWRGDAGLPRWLAYVTGVAALEQLVETITIFGKSGFLEPGGGMNIYLGAGLVAVAFFAIGFAVPEQPVATARS